MSAVLTGRVVLIEPNPAGHRLFYVRLLVERLVARNERPALLTSPAALTSPEFGVHLQHWADTGDLEVVLGSPTGPGSRSWRQAYLRVADRYAGTSGRVVVPDGDLWLRACVAHAATQLLRRRRARVRLLLMRPPTPGRRTGTALPRMRSGVKTLLACAAVLSGTSVQALRSAGAPSDVPRLLAWMPQVVDPVEMPFSVVDRQRLRTRLQLPTDRPICLVAGSLTARKGTGVVLEAWETLATHPQAPLLLLAGRTDADVRAQLGDTGVAALRSRDLVRVRDEYVSDDDLNAYIASADCVVLAYANEAPSGILGKAAVAGASVLAAGSMQVRAEVARLGIGVGVEATAGDIAAGVLEVLQRLGRAGTSELLERTDPAIFADELCGLAFPSAVPGRAADVAS